MKDVKSGKGWGYELKLRFPEELTTEELSGTEFCRMLIEEFEKELKKHDKDAGIIEAHYKSGTDTHGECEIVFQARDRKGKLTKGKLTARVGAKSLNVEFTTL